MSHTQQRKRLRELLSGTKCLSPATVHDALSARVAETVGFEIGMLPGSLLSITTLAAPDVNIYTLTECADQIRRITRDSNLSMVVDADHGFGNALNVMRTVEEFEHVGVAALVLEDTLMPAEFGQREPKLISLEEATGKMRAAVAARCDPSLIIAGRTSALVLEGAERALARARAYAAAGVDAMYLGADGADVNVFCTPQKLQEIKAIYEATRLPIIVGAGYGVLNKREDLAACGVRILLQGQQASAAAVKALRETYTHLFKGGAPADLKSKIASVQEMEQLTNAPRYKQWLSDFMR